MTEIYLVSLGSVFPLTLATRALVVAKQRAK